MMSKTVLIVCDNYRVAEQYFKRLGKGHRWRLVQGPSALTPYSTTTAEYHVVDGAQKLAKYLDIQQKAHELGFQVRGDTR